MLPPASLPQSYSSSSSCHTSVGGGNINYQQESPKKRMPLPESGPQETYFRGLWGHKTSLLKVKIEEEDEKDDEVQMTSPSSVNDSCLAVLNMLPPGDEVDVDSFLAAELPVDVNEVEIDADEGLAAFKKSLPNEDFSNYESYKKKFDCAFAFQNWEHKKDLARAAKIYEEIINNPPPDDILEDRSKIILLQREAKYHLALLFIKSKQRDEQNLQKAFALFSELTNYYLNAKFYLAKCYEEGLGVKQDLAEAKRRYTDIAFFHMGAAKRLIALKNAGQNSTQIVNPKNVLSHIL